MLHFKLLPKSIAELALSLFTKNLLQNASYFLKVKKCYFYRHLNSSHDALLDYADKTHATKALHYEKFNSRLALVKKNAIDRIHL